MNNEFASAAELLKANDASTLWERLYRLIPIAERELETTKAYIYAALVAPEDTHEQARLAIEASRYALAVQRFAKAGRDTLALAEKMATANAEAREYLGNIRQLADRLNDYENQATAAADSMLETYGQGAGHHVPVAKRRS